MLFREFPVLLLSNVNAITIYWSQHQDGKMHLLVSMSTMIRGLTYSGLWMFKASPTILVFDVLTTFSFLTGEPLDMQVYMHIWVEQVVGGMILNPWLTH